jgi:hypothetical protein
MVRFSISGSAAYGPRALDIRDRTAVAQALIVTRKPIETIVRDDNVATAMVWRCTNKSRQSKDLARVVPWGRHGISGVPRHSNREDAPTHQRI